MSRSDAAAETRIADLIGALEPLADTRLAPAKELVKAVLELHAQGLAALIAVLPAAVLETCLQSKEVALLLLLHGLHPHPTESRVRQALAGLRAELGTQGARVHFSELDDGLLSLRLEVTEQRNFSAPALRSEIEAAVLELAPEIGSIVIEGLPETGEVAFVPLANLRTSTKKNGAEHAEHSV